MKTRSITLVNPSLTWEATYAKYKRILLKIIDGKVDVSIEHIGATAIKDSITRPFVDIAVGLANALDLITLRDLLARRGYTYAAKVSSSEDIVMVKWDGIKVEYVLHITPIFSEVWQRMICFRNYLITHPEKATEFNELKKKLSYEEKVGPKEYRERKMEFINEVCKPLLKK